MSDRVLIYTRHYTVKEAAAFLTENGIKVSADTLQREIDDEKLGWRPIRGKVLIGEDQLEEYLRGITVCPNETARPKGASTKPESSGSTCTPDRSSGKSVDMTSEQARSAGSRRLQKTLGKLRKPSTNTSSKPGGRKTNRPRRSS